MIYRYFFLLLVFNNYIVAQDLKEGEYEIVIESNKREDSFCGLPFQWRYQVSINSSVKDTTFKKIDPKDSSSLEIEKNMDTIRFLYYTKDIEIKGTLAIPKCRISDFIGSIDIDASGYGNVLELREYYIPYRTGIWQYKYKEEEYERQYSTTFSTKHCE
jgi:hypothetical protein